MKIDKQFKQLTLKEYFYYIDHHKKYTDFNTLGLYRSLTENERLSIEEKIAVRDYANQYFHKFYDFLQVKDPDTYLDVSTLGMDVRKPERRQLWDDLRRDQQKILARKRLKHRNFGVYSKHGCGYDTCHLNGLMIRQGSKITEAEMYFDSDKPRWTGKMKSMQNRKERKQQQQIIRKQLPDSE
ncbi:hypothetical protein [Chitinophaga pinensis]|uniref:Uncharacterized protein n=1 Tax=Chitinophaga pinensis (strain ATCC 43595 / DSM 2588 / LMG 13176 / NBRC 15968 / NCIMB 11800 / UQM 2034) TaxID=485918 RepID=A0A979G9N0_CHIPD|nr:hypothetical protein [Chitinophaga pinensis]ACU63489.1 hypothetical protein Cpin_6080 [Chitinophaga pinensis DSM 2588]